MMPCLQRKTFQFCHDMLPLILMMCRPSWLWTHRWFSNQLPFISLSLVKSRSKFSTSASPAVRLANSWMSRCVIGSEEKKKLYFIEHSYCIHGYLLYYYNCIHSPTIVSTRAGELPSLSLTAGTSFWFAPSAGELEDCMNDELACFLKPIHHLDLTDDQNSRKQWGLMPPSKQLWGRKLLRVFT